MRFLNTTDKLHVLPCNQSYLINKTYSINKAYLPGSGNNKPSTRHRILNSIPNYNDQSTNCNKSQKRINFRKIRSPKNNQNKRKPDFDGNKSEEAKRIKCSEYPKNETKINNKNDQEKIFKEFNHAELQNENKRINKKKFDHSKSILNIQEVPTRDEKYEDKNQKGKETERNGDSSAKDVFPLLKSEDNFEKNSIFESVLRIESCFNKFTHEIPYIDEDVIEPIFDEICLDVKDKLLNSRSEEYFVDRSDWAELSLHLFDELLEISVDYLVEDINLRLELFANVSDEGTMSWIEDYVVEEIIAEELFLSLFDELLEISVNYLVDDIVSRLEIFLNVIDKVTLSWIEDCVVDKSDWAELSLHLFDELLETSVDYLVEDINFRLELFANVSDEGTMSWIEDYVVEEIIAEELSLSLFDEFLEIYVDYLVEDIVSRLKLFANVSDEVTMSWIEDYVDYESIPEELSLRLFDELLEISVDYLVEDIVLRLQLFSNVSEEVLKAEIEQCISQFSNLQKWKPFGFSNPHGYCYLNSVIQTLVSCKDFSNEFTSDNCTEILGKDEDSIFVKGLRDLIYYLKIQNKKGVKDSLKTVQVHVTESSSGDDVYKCFMNILTRVSNVIKTTTKQSPTKSSDNSHSKTDIHYEKFRNKNPGFVFDNFYGLLSFQIRCKICDHKCNESFQMIKSLALPVPNTKKSVTLETCIKLFFNDSDIETDDPMECKCTKPSISLKSYTMFSRCPKYLFMYLNRGSYFHHGDKNRTNVTCENIIKITTSDGNTNEYKLISVIDHMGSSDGGHYYCKCNFETDKWWLLNDTQVTQLFDDEKIVTNNTIVFMFRRLC